MPSLPFDESTTFSPPPAFGPYRVLHQIGSGVLGPVFRTYDPQSDRLVAVKVFRLDLLPEDVARLADGLRRLVGTAGYLAAGLEGTTAYLAMDYHAAETFDVALRHLAPAPTESALPILSAIADAIDAAWAAGPAFGHGSLHPRDIFVTPGSGELSITGFGVAPALEAIGARPPVRRPYTAPERAAGTPWDVRADVYSLGAIAHELLTGRRPAGPGEQDGSLPLAMAPELRVRIRRVLSKALAEEPSRRFASAREFVDALADPTLMPESAFTPDPKSIVAAEGAVPPPDSETESDTEATDAGMADAAPVATPAPPAVAAPIPRRAKVAAPMPRPPARVAPREPIVIADSAPAQIEPELHIADAPLRYDEPPRAVLPPMALPSPFPWLPFMAGIVAALILGIAIGYQFAIGRSPAVATESAPSKAAPPADRPVSNPAPAPAAPTSTAPGDTEVKIAPPPAPGKSPLPQGRIIVRSAPAGAAVAIDGKAAGRTPMTASDLALAGHSVTLTRPGFVAETRRVTLNARAPQATISVTLKEERAARPAAPATGSVTVDSRPRGAQVTIDGHALGVTPLSVPGLKPGEHAVRVVLAGYKPVSTTVTVKAGEAAKIAVTLERR